jgi:hypothetical protein
VSTSLLPFAQLDFAGALGLADGRYLARSGGEPSEVLICSTVGAPVRRRRRRRTRLAQPGSDHEPELALTRLTVVTPTALGDADEAARWLERLAADAEAAEAFVADAVRLINRALRAHATAAQDPYVNEVSAARAATTRVGYGDGDQVADGHWTDVRELERGEPRRRRADSLQPQERVAAVLGGREEIAACEPLLLRARLDLDQGRGREAALQLDVGLRALLAVPSDDPGPREREDLEALRGRREVVAAAARDAASVEPPAETVSELERTLEVCERVLRRRRIDPSL